LTDVASDHELALVETIRQRAEHRAEQARGRAGEQQQADGRRAITVENRYQQCGAGELVSGERDDAG
jgi:hypothetical protein